MRMNFDPLAILTSILFALTSPTTVFNGWVTVAIVRAPLVAVATTIKSVTIENLSTNNVVYVGNATVTAANGYALRAGANISIAIDDLNKIYVIGTAGNIVTYIAVN